MGKLEIIDIADTQSLVREVNRTRAAKIDEKTTLYFTNKEIAKMPKAFRNEFIAKKITAHVRKHKGGYEIRCQYNKQSLSVSAKELTAAKQKFIQLLNNYYANPDLFTSRKLKFGIYLSEYIEKVKKPFVKEATYKDYAQMSETYILPTFGEKHIDKITQFDLQDFVNGFIVEEKFRTAKKLVQFLKSVFQYATDDGKIVRNPAAHIRAAVYQQASGTALSRAEETALIAAFRSEPTVYLQAIVFMLYTGVRRSELASVKVADGWVSVVTGKQRKGLPPKIRHIPVSPMLLQFLPNIDVTAIVRLTGDIISRKIKEKLPSHHLHDLRHTFITRCQECGVSREIVSLWSGHAADSSITARVYTHLESNKTLQIDEISKVVYPV